MKVVVAGGTGFIGEPLCRNLLAAKHEVVVLSRRPARVRQGRGVEWGGGSDTSWKSEVSTADLIINLAGENIAEGRWTPSRKGRLLGSRVEATDALVSTLLSESRAGARLLSASAIGFYGPHADQTLDEKSESGSGFLAEICRKWETAAKQAAGSVEVVIVRIGVVLSSEGGALAKMLVPFRLGAGGRLGSGKQWMSWISRDDLLSVFLWLGTAPGAAGVYNATAPNPVTNQEFTTALGKVLHRPVILPAPAFALRVALGEMADELLLEGQKVVPRRLLEEGFPFQHATVAEALRDELKR